MRWWRVFLDKISGKKRDPQGVAPRRRQHERYAYNAKLSLKCGSWPEVADLITGDVSAGGLFVPTTREASVGDSAEVEIVLPNGGGLAVKGTVVNVSSASPSQPAGVGIRLDPMDGDTRERFELVLQAARDAQPRPVDLTEDPHSRVSQTGSLRAVDVAEVRAAEPDAEPVRPAPPPPPPPKTAPARRPSREPIVGIDLGTTYTAVAAIQGKRVSLLPWPTGKKATPTVVSFPGPHEILVGEKARARLATDPGHTVASPKRLLGRRYDDKEIAGFLGQAAYKTVEGPDGSVVVEIWRQPYAITQICSYLLDKARETAERNLGAEIRKCVLTVPVSFDDDRIKLLHRACSLANLEAIALIDEPSAAALANRFDPAFGGIVGVYDFGGGTFDFSVVDVSHGDFRVLATAGDTWLGGDDFDALLAEAAANQFWRTHKVDLRNQAAEWQRLMFACERAKRILSVEDEATIHVPEVLRAADGMVDLELSLDRATFERACGPTIRRSLATCVQALELLDMKPDDLSCIYLSGGTTYIPAVRKQLGEAFDIPVRTGVPPEHAVCLGAAIHAAQLQLRGASVLEER